MAITEPNGHPGWRQRRVCRVYSGRSAASACCGPRSAPPTKRASEHTPERRDGPTTASVRDSSREREATCWRSRVRNDRQHADQQQSQVAKMIPPATARRSTPRNRLRQPPFTRSRLANSVCVARRPSRRVLLRPCGRNGRLLRRGHRDHRGRLFRGRRPRRLGWSAPAPGDTQGAAEERRGQHQPGTGI
jgi:hypothetical protein